MDMSLNDLPTTEYERTFNQILNNTGSIDQAREETVELFVSEWLVLTDSGVHPNDYNQPILPIS